MRACPDGCALCVGPYSLVLCAVQPGAVAQRVATRAGDDLFLFSSDYPHPDGTKDPIQRFESTMTQLDDGAMTKFYSANFAALYRNAVPV